MKWSGSTVVFRAHRWRDTMIALIDRADPAILTEPQRSSLMNDPSRVFRGDANPAEIRSVAEKRRALPALPDNARTKLESVYGTAFFRMMRRTADDAVSPWRIRAMARVRRKVHVGRHKLA